jgi:hypothetical protein
MTLFILWLLSATTGPSPQQPPSLQPSFRYTGSAGCADVFLYAWNAERTEVLVAEVDVKPLKLGVGRHSIDAEKMPGVVRVRVEFYSKPQRQFRYCEDFITEDMGQPAVVWHATVVKGALTLGARGSEPSAQPFMYPATLQVDQLIVKSPDGVTRQTSAPVTLHGNVGWYAG